MPEIEFKEAAYAVAFLIYVIERLIAYFRNLKKKGFSGAKSFEKNWLMNEELYPILYDLMIEYSAIRVFIVQFHNGDKYYSGQSIQKMTCSHEVKRPGMKGVKTSIIAVPVDDNVHKIVASIRINEYFCLNKIEQEEDTELRERLSYLSVKSNFCFGINDSEGRVVGTMHMHFNYSSPVNSEQVQGILMTVAQLSSILTKHSNDRK